MTRPMQSEAAFAREMARRDIVYKRPTPHWQNGLTIGNGDLGGAVFGGGPDSNGIVAFYDDGGSIGRRYARMDEVGTPFCITVDYQSAEDNTVTIRDRDSTKQARVRVSDIITVVADLLSGEKKELFAGS